MTGDRARRLHLPTQTYVDISNVVNWFFIVIYVGETFAKLFAFGVVSWREDDDDESFMKLRSRWRSLTSPYFRDAWNSFDFTVVAFSVIDKMGIIDFPVLKLLRVLRSCASCGVSRPCR